MKSIQIFVLLSLPILFTCCGAKKNINKRNTTDTIIEYSKYSCFGKCQEFDFFMYSNQTARLIGKNNIDLIGDHSTTIKDDKYQNIISIFEKNKIASLDSTYLVAAADLQKIKLIYNGYRIDFHKRKAPSELLASIEVLDILISELNWEKEN